LTDLVEHLDRQTAGIIGGLEHDRRYRCDEHRLADPGSAVTADVAHDLAATGGVSDQHGVVQVERVHQVRQAVGMVVHVVAVPRLGGATVAAAVMGDSPETTRGHEQQLLVPGIGVERPAVAEYHRTTDAQPL
jgi:hypothetical protein